MSSRLTGRSAATNAGCVAIDLGATAVRIVELEWGKGGDSLAGSRVVRRGSAPLPAGVWNDLDTHRDAVIAAIQKAMSAAGISSRTVVACLPRRLVTVRYLRLPAAPPEQMQGMVAFEAQQYVLFPVDEVVLDHCIMTGAGGKGPLDQEDLETVLLAAARRSVIANVMSIFDRAGLDLVQLSVSALALAEIVRNSIGPTAMIDLEPGEIDVAVVSDSQLLFTRASALDMTPTDEITAQRRKVEEVFRSFTAYQNEFRGRQLTQVYLGGPDLTGPSSVELERALTEIIDVPVQPYSGPLVPGGDPDLRAYLTAIGTGLQTRDGSIAAINLVPHERAELKAQQSRGRQRNLALAAAAVLLLLAFSGTQRWLKTRSIEYNEQVKANEKLDTLNDALKKRQKAFDARDGLYKELNKELDKPHPSVDVLVALDSVLPQSGNLWITQFSFERNKLLTVRGEAKSASAPVDLVLALQRSHAFRNVQLSYIGDAQDTEYDSSQASADVVPATTGTRAASQPTLVQAAARQAVAPPQPATTTTPGASPGNPGGNGAPPGFPGGPPGGPPGGFRGPNAAPAATPPVPSLSPPAGGVQPSAPAAAAKPAPALKRNTRAARPALTSFVITCKVNTKARTLLPTSGPATTSSKSTGASEHKTTAKSAVIDADTSDAESGGDDAGTQ